MHEFKHGELHSGSARGPVVTNRKQAVAIALSEQRAAGNHESHRYNWRSRKNLKRGKD